MSSINIMSWKYLSNTKYLFVFLKINSKDLYSFFFFLYRKFDEQHMKVARQRQLQMKINEEKLKKAAEHKNKKEQMVKEETLKKLKLISEQNALRKQALDAKMIPVSRVS